MGLKRLKLAKGLSDLVPTSVNFSLLEKEMEENEIKYEPSDDGEQEQKTMDKVVCEEMVVNILYNLDPREQLIFIFQLLRDNGYQIDHAAFAKVIHLSRRQYMRLLDDVRLKTWLYIQGYRKQNGVGQSHKGA